jgi:hypothetical protein
VLESYPVSDGLAMKHPGIPGERVRMTIKEAAARLVVERLDLGGAFYTYQALMRLALRESRQLGLVEWHIKGIVCEKFCSQTDLGRLVLSMAQDTRNHEEIRICGKQLLRLCLLAERWEEFQPGGALHTECIQKVEAAKAAARDAILDIIR